jgi:hypothetical protein
MAGGTLFDAQLELTVIDADNGWEGGEIELVRLSTSWAEGNGSSPSAKLSPILDTAGATWACRGDINVCSVDDSWHFGDVKTVVTPDAKRVQVHKGKTKAVRFDVTEDVRAFLSGVANDGWLVKAADSVTPGAVVRFGSRESDAGPRLILNASSSCPATGPAVDERSHLRALQCSSPPDGVTPCNLRAQAKANADRQAGARLYIQKAYSPAQTLMLTRDRGRKLRDLYANPSLLSAFCSADGDGDMIPDTVDACPSTLPLKPTTANGCDDPNLPVTPPRPAIDTILDGMGINVDPRCKGAPAPAFVRPMVTWQQNPDGPVNFSVARQGSTGRYTIQTPPVVGQPSGCELEYQFSVVTVHADGTKRFTTLSFSSQNDPRVVHWSDPLPTGQLWKYIYFHFSPSQGGDAAQWGNDTTAVGISAQIVNGNGDASGWTPIRWMSVREY